METNTKIKELVFKNLDTHAFDLMPTLLAVHIFRCECYFFRSKKLYFIYVNEYFEKGLEVLGLFNVACCLKSKRFLNVVFLV